MKINKLGSLLIITTEDITERKQTELENTKALALLKQSEEVAKMGSWEYDIRSDQMAWSQGMYRLFDLPANSPVSPQTFLDCAREADQPRIRRIIHPLPSTPSPLEEVLCLWVNGQPLTWQIKATVLCNQQGVPVKILGVVLDVSEVERLQKENLQMRLHQQKTLLLGILEAQEEERRRLSESLHNGVGQLLYAAKLNLEQVARLVPPPVIGTTEELLNAAIAETRRVSHELVPVVLKDFGLRAAIMDLCRQYSGSTFKLSCEVEGLENRLDSHLELAIFRMSQELINNVVKHAQATEANFLLVQEDGGIDLKVRDNGKGIDQGRTPAGGIGLRFIRDRVKLLNGTLAITRPRTGKGTQVNIRIPLEA